jgi:hypothetical protein
MGDFQEGLKREVAEVKFLIHDLRVEKFINDVIHFHVTLNADLEIHGVDPARILHEEDVLELRRRGGDLRNSYRVYSNAVKSFSPDRTVLATGRGYIQNVYEICELILNPMWGRVDKVLSFLPADCRSVAARNHYRNCIHWICGVYYRIENFLIEAEEAEIHEVFDVARDIEDFTRNIIYGYVVEKSGARVELQLEELATAVVEGNRARFRRMYFNLVMNAVDAMQDLKVGILNVSTSVENGRVALRVRDSGCGMPPDKIERLLADRETLDGELHSLGFVFVRQTVAAFGGEISIESQEGKGTSVTVRLPTRPDAAPDPRRKPRCEKYEVRWGEVAGELPGVKLVTAEAAPEEVSAPSGTGPDRPFGRLILDDFRTSQASHPGSIFAIGVTDGDVVDLFMHRPYEQYWNITHEDLSPMYYQATLRGRLEEDEEKRPVLILKAPQNVREFFELKELPESEFSAERFVTMVHDEYVRAARRLIATGLPAQTRVELTDVAKFFGDDVSLPRGKPFTLEALAAVPLSSEVD